MILNIDEINETKIQEMIDNGVEENLHLDYKECKALDKKIDIKKKELSKDVSSFANSDGGTIIFGVIEEGHKPIKFDIGYNPADISKEWIEQVINSNISPKIENITIVPIKLTNSLKYIYVVSIPTSDRAPHQANDKRYYKRYNFESVPMEEYEIKELYFRNIISQTEFRKLQAHVRENTYKPLYSKLIELRDKLFSVMHPHFIYYNENPFRIQSFDAPTHFHDFRIWHSMKISGDWIDIIGIGNEDTLNNLNEFGDKIIKYNSLIDKTYNKVGDYLSRSVGQYIADSYTSSDGWSEIREEILQKEPFLIEDSKTIYYLRNSPTKKFKELLKLSDMDMFKEFCKKLEADFPNLKEIHELAKEIKKDVLGLINEIDIKIRETYPK